MSQGPGFLEFFILEASDYAEQLDGLLLGGGSKGPDADALQRVARALRGTATMAKLPAFAELAGSVEKIGRAIRDGSLQWDPSLGGALAAAIDDLKTLLHAARAWSPTDDRVAADRNAELLRFIPGRSPARATPHPSDDPTAPAAAPFLAAETANIAAGLELLTTRVGDADTAANVLRRIRALRGVAGVREVGPLADALEATEAAGRGLETGTEGLTVEARRLLETAAAYLRALSAALQSGSDVHAPSDAREAFDVASEAWSARGDGSGGDRERIIPIENLFYGGGGPGLVEVSPHPPTTAAERFRLELVSLGEHLGQLVGAARHAIDGASSIRAQRELRRALEALEATALSFGEEEVAAFIRTHVGASAASDALSLNALADLAAVVAQPGAGSQRLRARLRELSGAPAVAGGIVADSSPEGAATEELPVPTAPAPPRSGEVLDPGAAALIDAGILALETFSDHPSVAPRLIPEDEGLVSIDALLYRGRAALDRAVEIRDAIRHDGPTSDPDALEELFDLLELARAE